MPAVWVRLLPEDLAELDAEVAKVRVPARVTCAMLATHFLREALAARRHLRALNLAAALRPHPLHPGAGLPVELQDRCLAAITSGAVWMIPEFLRAGEWEDQIAALARRWRQDGLSHEELCAAGMTGLLRAIRGARPGAGWRSYAYTWIRKELERLCRASGSIVMETEDERRVRRAVEKWTRKGLTPEAIAEKTSLSPAQVARGLEGRRPLGWKEITER